MRKVLSFSAFLMMGLLVSQILPGAVGEAVSYTHLTLPTIA